MTRLEAFLAALLTVVLPPKGKRHRPVKATAPATAAPAPIPAITRNHPYQEPTP